MKVLYFCLTILFLSSCNKHDGKIYLEENEYYLENTSGDKILTYTIEKAEHVNNTYSNSIFYVRLNPGEYKPIGKKNQTISVPPTNIFRRDTINTVYAWPKLAKKYFVGENMSVNLSKRLEKNIPPQFAIKFYLDDNKTFLNLIDSTNTKDTVFYKYRYITDTKTGIKKNPSIEYKNTFEIKGAVLYNNEATPMQ